VKNNTITWNAQTKFNIKILSKNSEAIRNVVFRREISNTQTRPFKMKKGGEKP
jgi:hypothetical protein